MIRPVYYKNESKSFFLNNIKTEVISKENMMNTVSNNYNFSTKSVKTIVALCLTVASF